MLLTRPVALCAATGSVQKRRGIAGPGNNFTAIFKHSVSMARFTAVTARLLVTGLLWKRDGWQRTSFPPHIPTRVWVCVSVSLCVCVCVCVLFLLSPGVCVCVWCPLSRCWLGGPSSPPENCVLC